MENREKKEIVIVNRGKIAYLLERDIYHTEVRLTVRDGKEIYGFVFDPTEEVIEAINDFNNDEFLKRYNHCFSSINFEIRKAKQNIEQ